MYIQEYTRTNGLYSKRLTAILENNRYTKVHVDIKLSAVVHFSARARVFPTFTVTFSTRTVLFFDIYHVFSLCKLIGQ